MKIQLKFNSESIVGLAIILMGMYFYYSGSFIESFGDDVVGPQFIPRITALTLALLGLVLLVLSIVRFEGDSLKDPVADLVGSGFFAKVFFPLGLTAIVYVTLFSQFGYFASTLVVTPIVLWIFGNRGIPKIILMTVVTALIFYLIFIQFLGVFDVPGALFNLSELIRQF